MYRRRSRGIVEAIEIDPLVRLWLLRILVPLSGHQEFIRSSSFKDDPIAAGLGLGHWIDPADGNFNAGEIHAELRLIHRKAEKQCRAARPPAFLRSNVERLSGLVGLSRTDCRIFEFAVMIHNERMLDDTADFLGQLSSVKVFRVLSVILGLPEADIRVALGSEGILSRSGLISADRGISTLRGKLDLLSNGFADRMVSSEADPVHLLRGTVNGAAPGHLSLEDYRHIRTSLEILLPYLRQTAESGCRGVNVFLYGAPGTGKTQLVRALAAGLGCDLFEIAGEDDKGDPVDGEHRLRAFRAAQSFLARCRAIIVFDEAEDVFDDGYSFFGRKSTAQTRKGWINRTLEENPVPAFWLSNSIRGLDPAFIRRFDMVFELPVPPKTQRKCIVQDTCRELIDDSCAARIAEVEILAPAVVAKAASVVRAIGDRFDSAQKVKALEHLIGNTLEAQGHVGLRPHDPNRLPDLYDPVFVHADADLAQLAEGLKISRTGRLCLYGPPGTGKTAYGRWLAEQLDLPLLVKRASDLLSPFVGENEQNIARAFREAEREKAVLLIDEVDSFLQDRRGAVRSWEVSLVNELLTQMESFAGVFIASTNLMDGLDKAALRRFDIKVKFDYMESRQSVALLRRYCEKLGLPTPDDANTQAVQGLKQLTPGDFAAAMRQHRFRPIKSAPQLVEILEAECAIKEGLRPAIGFIQ